MNQLYFEMETLIHTNFSVDEFLPEQVYDEVDFIYCMGKILF